MMIGVRWSVLTGLAPMALLGCTETKGSVPEAVDAGVQAQVPARAQAQTDVADTTAKILAANGIPTDVAAFFAATKVTSNCPNDTTCVYVQTFLTGATREITLTVSPNRKYAPTVAEIRGVSPGGAPVYGFKYASDFKSDPERVTLNYYVARQGLPVIQRKTAQSLAPPLRGGELIRFASATPAVIQDGESAVRLALQAGGGAGINWTEVGKKGTDAAIGAAIDKATAAKIKTGPLGSIYSLASALSDVSSAMDLGKQNIAWQKELDALEKCAANPTNQVSRSDLSYSDRTVATIQEARRELKEVNSVRFLNQMTEKGADLNPVTAVLAVGLKAGFAWSEQTLGDYSEKTIMREARLAVVKCDDPEDLAGNMVYNAECTVSPTHKIVYRLVGQVSWEWQMGIKYLPRGKYTFTMTETFSKNCVHKSTGQGDLTGTGYMFVWDDKAQQKEQGYGYEVRFVNLPTLITNTRPCGISSQDPTDIDWIPIMHGYQSANGNIKGTTVGTSCLVGQPQTLEWDFAVPPKNR